MVSRRQFLMAVPLVLVVLERKKPRPRKDPAPTTTTTTITYPSATTYPDQALFPGTS